MNYHLIIGIESFVCILIVILFLKNRHIAQKKLYENQSINNQIKENDVKLKAKTADLVSLKNEEKNLKEKIALYELSVIKNDAEKNQTLTELKKTFKTN